MTHLFNQIFGCALVRKIASKTDMALGTDRREQVKNVSVSLGSARQASRMRICHLGGRRSETESARGYKFSVASLDRLPGLRL
jgi:hypothetical protein